MLSWSLSISIRSTSTMLGRVLAAMFDAEVVVNIQSGAHRRDAWDTLFTDDSV